MRKHQSFTISYNGYTNVLISEALVLPAFNPKTSNAPQEGIKYKAIWDTGATNTVITNKIVDECKLKPIGVTKVGTANGIMDSLVYLVAIGLPHGVGMSNVRVTEGKLSPDVDVLIGMDIIIQGDFAITNLNGKTTFSFRSPSSDCIDFVKQAKSTSIGSSPQKVGRNAPCPCGSGKKYKKCHGK